MAKNKSPEEIPFAIASGNKTALITLSVVCVFLLLACFALGAIAAKQYVRKEKTPEPIIFEVSKAEHKVVQIERGDLGATQQSLLRAVSLREYVEWREIINHIDEKERWKKVRLMSGDKVFKHFYNQMNPDINKDSVVNNKKYTRKIEIINDYPIPSGSKNVHRIEFYAVDSLDGEEFPRQRYAAVIQYDVSDAFVSYKDRFINIAGLKVINYQIIGA